MRSKASGNSVEQRKAKKKQRQMQTQRQKQRRYDGKEEHTDRINNQPTKETNMETATNKKNKGEHTQKLWKQRQKERRQDMKKDSME